MEWSVWAACVGKRETNRVSVQKRWIAATKIQDIDTLHSSYSGTQVKIRHHFSSFGVIKHTHTKWHTYDLTKWWYKVPRTWWYKECENWMLLNFEWISTETIEAHTMHTAAICYVFIWVGIHNSDTRHQLLREVHEQPNCWETLYSNINIGKLRSHTLKFSVRNNDNSVDGL